MLAQETAAPSISPSAILDESFLQSAIDLLAIHSTYDRPTELRQALAYAIAMIRRHPGITIETFEQNGLSSILAYYGPTRPKRFKILLNGHLDVVPGKDDQFQPYINKERLYGRGSLDMKVATLVMIEAFCQVAPRAAYPLGLQIVTDEETGGYNGAAYQFQQGVTTDFFLTGEQSNNDVVVAAKGLCWVKIKQKGIASHGAYLWRGDNAILKLSKLIEKIHHVYPVPNEESWVTTANVAQLQATSEGFFNRVPDDAELHMDFRFLPEDGNFASKEAFRDFIASLDPTVEVEFVTFEKAPSAQTDNPLVQQLIAITSHAKGSPVQPIRRHASSDGRHLLADPLVQVVEYGVGGAHEHSDGEYADLKSVAIMRQALPEFLLSVS